MKFKVTALTCVRVMLLLSLRAPKCNVTALLFIHSVISFPLTFNVTPFLSIRDFNFYIEIRVVTTLLVASTMH